MAELRPPPAGRKTILELRRFVQKREDGLSPLSRREALKNLANTGAAS